MQNSILERINQNQVHIQSVDFNKDLLNKINYKFRLDWNYYSNHLEGGTLTKEETRSVMVDIIDIRGKSIKDVMEMKGHDNIITEIIKIGQGEKRISEKRIINIHHAIMHEEDTEKRKQIGKWKTKPNKIINYKGEKIDFVKPENVKEKLHELLNKTNAKLDLFFANKKTEHPILIATNFHLEFLSIHPLYDGNGRTARILTNLILISCGFPPIIIKNNVKDTYYKLLADIQAYGGNLDLLENFLGNRLLESQQLILDALDGKDIEEMDDVDKEITLFKKQLTNKDEVIQKSDKIVYDIYQNSIKPLLTLFIEKHEQFDELFSETNQKMIINNSNETKNNLNDWLKTYDEFGSFNNPLKVSLSTFQNIETKEPLDSLNLTLIFNKFKRDDENTFDSISGIFIEFQEFKYLIRTNYNLEITKFYSKKLTKLELDNIVNTSVRGLFEEIKNRIKKDVNHD